MSLTDTLEVIDSNAEVLVEDTQKMAVEDWLELRRLGIGGSDAAATVGMSPWTSPYALWANKVYGIDSGSQNEAMLWGHVLEEPIGMEFGRREGIDVRPYKAMLRSREWPWMVLNLDLIAAHRGVVEVKNVNGRKEDQWDDGNVPADYNLQGQHELAVTGLDVVHFAALIGGQRLASVTIERDEALIEVLVERERQFWEMVQNGTPPTVDGSESTSDILASLYAEPQKQSSIELTERELLWLSEAKATKAQIKALEEHHDSLVNSVKAFMGDHEIGVDPATGKIAVTWKQQTQRRVSPTLLAELHPEIDLEGVKSESTFRKFDIKKTK